MSNPLLIKSYVAGGTIAKCRIVKFGTADGEVVQASAAADLAIGVAISTDTSVAGNRIDVVRGGIALVEFGGTVTRGQAVTADSNGKAVAASPAAGVNNSIIGIAEVSAVAGDIADILIAPSTLQG